MFKRALRQAVVLVVWLLPRPAWSQPALPITDSIFKHGFESGSLSGWSSNTSDGGDLSVSGAAALASTSFGMQAVVDDLSGINVRDDSPSNESRYRARFHLDANGFDPGEAAGHQRTRVLLAFDDASQRTITLVLRRLGGNYAVRGRVRLDDGTRADTPFVPLGAGAHAIEFDWRRATGPGAGDGSFELFVDDASEATLTGLDNDTSTIDFVRMGPASVKTGAAGTLFFDEFESRRVSFIGLSHPPKDCGDGAGPIGQRIHCACGDTVVTNTLLEPGLDPVTTSVCGGDGLIVAPGVTLDLNAQTLHGSGIGTGLTAVGAATVTKGRVEGFEVGIRFGNGAVDLNDVASGHNLGTGMVVGSAGGTTASVVTMDGPASSVSDNGGAGIVVHPGSGLTLAGEDTVARLPILRNAGYGLHVRGALQATNVEVGFSASQGVRVDSDDPVSLVDCDVHDSGHHPDGAVAGQAGLYVLRAAHVPPPDPLDPTFVPTDGFVVQGLSSQVHDNTGDGVVLGDLEVQTGVVNGLVGDTQIFRNQVGIRVQQSNAGTERTVSVIIGNNVFDNLQGGAYIGRSFQNSLGGVDRRTISANEFHHNAVVGGACTPATADQFASQVVFDGPIGDTDPTVSNLGDPDPCDTPGEITGVTCIGPDLADHPADYRCYWGGDDSDREDTLAECNAMNNPNGSESNGISNHCLWNGTQCRIAWDMGGREGTEACDTSRNRIYAYVNDVNEDPFTQRGVAAINGAYVRARRNVWGVGGPFSGGVFESSQGNSRVDPGDDCGSVSTCP